MSKMVSVDPTGWLLDRALNDYYRAVLPMGDTSRPLNELAALMQTPPGREPHSSSAATWLSPQDKIVVEALAELPEPHRMVLECRYGAQLSLRQIERVTGIPKTTVARRRDEAPQLLAEILKRKMPALADKYYLD